MRDHTDDPIVITLSDYDESGMATTLDVSNITTTTIDSSTDFDSLFSFEDLSITLNEPIEFEDHMPDVAKVEDMCNDYPALKHAYEKFKTMYALVHQDWKGRQDAENEPPF